MEVDEECLQLILSTFITLSKKDKTTVAKFFTYKDNRFGYRITNSALKQQQPIFRDLSQHQTAHPTTTTLSNRRSRRRPTAIWYGATVSNNSNKRKRTELVSPTDASAEFASTPAGAATPETARDATSLSDLARGNISLLSSGVRDMSDDEEKSTTVDHQPTDANDAVDDNATNDDDDTINADDDNNADEADKAEEEVTQSNFFHSNRFNILATGKIKDGNDNSDDSSDDNDDGNGYNGNNGKYSNPITVNSTRRCSNNNSNNNNSDDSGDDSKKYTCRIKSCGRRFHQYDHDEDIQRFSRSYEFCPKCFDRDYYSKW